MTGYLVSEEQIQVFERDGAIRLEGLVGEDWLAKLRAAAGEAMDMAPNDPGMYYFKRIRLWRKITTFGSLCTESHLPAVAAQLLRTEKINLLYDQLFVKDASMVERTTWHNDQPYWPVRGDGALSFWIAIEDLDATMGTLEFIRASHRWEAWYQPFVGNANLQGPDDHRGGDRPRGAPLRDPGAQHVKSYRAEAAHKRTRPKRGAKAVQGDDA